MEGPRPRHADQNLYIKFKDDHHEDEDTSKLIFNISASPAGPAPDDLQVTNRASKAAVVRKKCIRRSGIPFFTPQFSPAGIRNAIHQELMSRRLGNLLEYSVAALAVRPSVHSDPVFLVQGWNVGGRDCNGPPNIGAFAECVSR